MNKTVSYLLTTASVTATLLALPGCDSGSKVASNSAAVEAAPMVSNDFSFPDVTEENGTLSVTIPEGPLPNFSARRTLASGSGSTIEFGDPVVVDYQVFSWTTGELVESSDEHDEAITLQAGVTGGAPEYLTKSLLGRNIGDTMQIVFAAGMQDLPSYLDQEDAYVVIVELI